MPPDKQNQEPEPTDEEKAFWDKFTGTLDGWWDNKMKTYQEERDKKPPATGTSRTGGKRVTLPGLIADMVFGPHDD